MNLCLHLHNRTIQTDFSAFVMGVINLTSDSFYPLSRQETLEKAVLRVKEMIQAGADIIDIGGESTRPGAQYISAEQQIEKIIPLVKEIRCFSDIPISIDTRSKLVMEEAFAFGADICNDISALEDDPELVIFIAQKQIPIILMHKQGTPRNMQENPFYKDVTQEILQYLLERAMYAQENGIQKEKIIIDPGIGFGKTLVNNCDVMKNISKFTEQGYPVLLGLSNKTCIGQITGKNVYSRMAGTLAANTLAVLRGTSFLRVHDVGGTIDMLKIIKEFR